MSVSHPAVHPVEVETVPPGQTDGPPPLYVRMKNVEGMGGTAIGLAFRLAQFLFATLSLSVMATTPDFASVTAFCFLVAAAGLQGLWSLSLAIIDAYALLVGRCLNNHCVVSFFAIGDGVTSTLTLAAACACAGITVLIDNDFGNCRQNHCIQFETATAMAFLSWFASIPSFFLNFWSAASQ